MNGSGGIPDHLPRIDVHDAAAREAFIRENTCLLPVPHAPEISLYVADEATALWQKTEDELGKIGLPPPFWAFAWAGGQALARYILDHPDVVAGRHVLDFASGSGLVAIAACKAGAASVQASDIDPFAISSMRINMQANGVSFAISQDDLVGTDGRWDAALAGDVSYERNMATRVTHWLLSLKRRGARVLIGDPGRAYLARDLLVSRAEYQVPVSRALEDTEIKRTQVWEFSRQ